MLDRQKYITNKDAVVAAIPPTGINFSYFENLL
jgi:hypothetical protein